MTFLQNNFARNSFQKLLKRSNFLALVIIFIGSLAAAQAAPVRGVPAARLAHLRHGINLSGWFAQVYDPQGYTQAHLQNWVTPSDMALIKSMGFDYVRLSVNPKPLFNERQSENIPSVYLGYLDTAIKMALDHGLAVVIDIHPDSDFKASLKDDTSVQQFTDFWRALAAHYSSWDPDRIFLEIMNEPEMQDPYRWLGIETKIAAAIREAAPQHTIIAAGARWSDNDDLVFLEPLRDPNVIYNFHFYEPHIFTHQGAAWGTYYWHWLKDLHYPSSIENSEKVAEKVQDPVDRLNVIRYGFDHWDAARMNGEIKQAADWASRNHVPLTCDEFGVFRNANPDDRVRWISDVRSAFEHYGIGWAMWDYDGNFGVITKTNGQATPDEPTLHALGLK
jgi:endoglucanase